MSYGLIFQMHWQSLHMAVPPPLYLTSHSECSSLQALDWNLCPETPITWLKLYSQVEAQKGDENFLVPQFSQDTYIQMTQVTALHRHDG